MSRKISVLIEDSTMKLLRKKQAELIRKSAHGVSFSYVVNKILRENVKKI